MITLCSIKGIAYQVNDSLLAGNNVSSTYTNQPITVALNYDITGNQSGEYFPNLKRGEFTSFAKGDLSHLMQDLSNITTQGIIEFCQSIKKGSNSATRFNQLLGSIPSRSNSLRPNVFSQLAKLMFDSFAATSNCSFNSGVIRILNWGDCPSPLGLLSRFVVDKWSPIRLISILIGGHLNMVKPIKSTPPNNATNTIRGLITSDKYTIEVTMKQHNTPVTGRNSLTPNTSFKWLFLALERNNLAAKPCRIETTAPNEHDARLMLVRDYILLFAGRVPVQEVAA